MAAQRVIVDRVPVMVAGGVESISCVQNEANRHMIMEAWLQQNKPEVYWSMPVSYTHLTLPTKRIV